MYPQEIQMNIRELVMAIDDAWKGLGRDGDAPGDFMWPDVLEFARSEAVRMIAPTDEEMKNYGIPFSFALRTANWHTQQSSPYLPSPPTGVAMHAELSTASDKPNPLTSPDSMTSARRERLVVDERSSERPPIIAPSAGARGNNRARASKNGRSDRTQGSMAEKPRRSNRIAKQVRGRRR